MRHTLSVILCLLPYPEIRCGVPFKCRPNCHNRNGKRCFYCACLQDTALWSTRSAASPNSLMKHLIALFLVVFCFSFFAFHLLEEGGYFLVPLNQICFSISVFGFVLLLKALKVLISDYMNSIFLLSFHKITFEKQRWNQKSYQNMHKCQIFTQLCGLFWKLLYWFPLPCLFTTEVAFIALPPQKFYLVHLLVEDCYVWLLLGRCVLHWLSLCQRCSTEKLHLIQITACPQPFDRQVRGLSHSKGCKICIRWAASVLHLGIIGWSNPPNFNPSREAMGTIFYSLW